MTYECAWYNVKQGKSIPYKKETLKKIRELIELKPCEDAISRQEIIKAMYDLCADGKDRADNPWRDNPNIDAIIYAIENLPSVQPNNNRVLEDIKAEINYICECGGYLRIHKDDVSKIIDKYRAESESKE